MRGSERNRRSFDRVASRLARRWRFGAVGVLIACTTVVVYLNLPAPASLIGDMVGLRPMPPHRDDCRLAGPRWAVAFLQTREIICSWARPSSATRIQELDELTYDVWTRRVRRAERSWRSRDGQLWRQELDSARATLQRAGGTQCFDRPRAFTSGLMPTDTGVNAPAHASVWEYWRFPTFLINLSGGETSTRAAGDATWQWVLFVRASRLRQGLCT
jgi:hypothetical protein